jgi:hypothetical protein
MLVLLSPTTPQPAHHTHVMGLPYCSLESNGMAASSLIFSAPSSL